MLTLKQIQRRLKGYSSRYVADFTGLSNTTIWKYQKGRIADPKHGTMAALCHFIETEERKNG